MGEMADISGVGLVLVVLFQGVGHEVCEIHSEEGEDNHAADRQDYRNYFTCDCHG